jgi:hypothetical protein
MLKGIRGEGRCIRKMDLDNPQLTARKRVSEDFEALFHFPNIPSHMLSSKETP